MKIIRKIIYFLFVCLGVFYSCKDEEQVLLNADFVSDKQTISAGEKICFMDKSTGEPVRWDWSFEGENLVCLICLARKSFIIIRELIL